MRIDTKTINQGIAAISLLLIFSCSPDKPQTAAVQAQGTTGNAPTETAEREYSLRITPENAFRNTPLFLATNGFDISEAKVEWLVNGRVVDTPQPSGLKSSELRKGDRIEVRALLRGKELMSNIVKLRNSLPEVRSMKVVPEVFRPGDTLGVEVSGADADGDNISFSYEWIKNGEPAGNKAKMDSPVKKGDKILLKVTPFDGEAYGREVFFNSEIMNLPPVITVDRNMNFDGPLFTYQVKASDPDGDPLTFSLKSAPKDMTINPKTGLVSWNIPQDFKGKTSFTACVNDGHGGETTSVFNVEINPFSPR